MKKNSPEYIRKNRIYRIAEILRMLYGGKTVTVKDVCQKFFIGEKDKKSDIRLIQRDFQALNNDTHIPIESLTNYGNELIYYIRKDQRNTGQKEVGDLEYLATLFQNKYMRIFKDTGFQEVLDNTYSIILDYVSTDIQDTFEGKEELLDFFHNIEPGIFNYSTWTKDIGFIITAILNQEFIQYKYRSAGATEYKN